MAAEHPSVLLLGSVALKQAVLGTPTTVHASSSFSSGTGWPSSTSWSAGGILTSAAAAPCCTGEANGTAAAEARWPSRSDSCPLGAGGHVDGCVETAAAAAMSEGACTAVAP